MHSDPTGRGQEVPEDPVLESASLGASQAGGKQQPGRHSVTFIPKPDDNENTASKAEGGKEIGARCEIHTHKERKGAEMNHCLTHLNT